MVVCCLLCGGVLFSVVVSWLRFGVRCGVFGVRCVLCVVCLLWFGVNASCGLHGGSPVCCLMFVCWCMALCVA